ncbi:MAG: CopG family transcriptional regulator [Gammaproteobacteria bacterium]|nr:CopG family transcriptional regulator [Gammaproteobacteria bacterium]
MLVISIRLPEELLEEADKCAESLHLKRTLYIRKAIEQFNQSLKKEHSKKRLIKASLKTRAESRVVNKEFNEIRNDSSF